MALDHEISDAQKRMTHGVYVISTVCEGRVNALTAAWVARASFTPPLVTVSVGKPRFTHDMIKKSGVFAVNVLGADNIATGKHFGLKTGRRTEKFADVEYDTAATGSPLLKDCVAWLDCRVVSSADAGDHTLFIGEVVEARVLRKDAEVLTYDRDAFFK